MADGFLEQSFYNYSNKKSTVKTTSRTLTTLLKKNRSYRGYDKGCIVSETTLERIVAVNEYLPSAKNQQALRFKLVTRGNEADRVLANIKLGGMLPELHLPFAGTEPEAFIIICSNVPENKMLDIDIGISAQSMLLRAVELGYNGIIIAAFNAARLKEELKLSPTPLLVVAIGKGAETIQLSRISEGESKAYYREDGVHIVPKIKWEDLIVRD